LIFTTTDQQIIQSLDIQSTMAAVPATKFALRCSIAGHEKDVRALTPLYFPDNCFVSGSRDVTAKVWQPNE